MKQTRPCLLSESIKVSGDKCLEMHHDSSWLRASSLDASVETLLGDTMNPRGGEIRSLLSKHSSSTEGVCVCECVGGRGGVTA